MSERFRPYAAVHLFLIKDGQILLARRYQTGHEDGNYGVVSGHIDGEESVTKALVREAAEEAGIQIQPENLQVVHTMHRKNPDREYIDFYLKTDHWEGDPRVMEPSKCDDMSWFPLDQLPENTIDYIKIAIDQYAQGQTYSESGW